MDARVTNKSIRERKAQEFNFVTVNVLCPDDFVRN